MTVYNPEDEREDAAPDPDGGLPQVPPPGSAGAPLDLDDTDPAPIAD